MSQGERGGTTTSFDQAKKLHEEFKADWCRRIKWRIVECLVTKGTFHASDLLPLEIPADAKQVIGSCTRAAKEKGIMLETDRRYSTKAPGGHGRRSPEYEVNPAGRSALAERLHEHKRRLPVPEPTPLFEEPEFDGPGHIDLDQRSAA